MNAMKTLTAAGSSRTRRGGLVAALVAVMAMLAGCSSSGSNPASAEFGEYSDGGGDIALESGYSDQNLSDGDVGFSMGTDEYSAAANSAGSPAADRSVIVTGAMYMTVEDPIAAADEAIRIVRGAGGRIDARSETAPDERDGGSASLTLRIPSRSLDAVVEDLRELGTVDQFGTDSYDVTNQVTDLEARISTLRASTARIEGLLKDAKDIADIIKLENELDRRQSELESLEAQQRGLTDQVAMSTIQLSLTTEPAVPVDDSPQSFWDGVVAGWNDLVGFISDALIALGKALPTLLLLAILFFAGRGLLRSRRKRQAVEDTAVAVTTKKPAAKKPAAKAGQR